MTRSGSASRSFGRRKSGDEQQNDEVEPELSWWTCRSDEDQVTAEDDVAHADYSDGGVEEDSPADEPSPAAEKQSIWKRELSFGRKPENGNAFAEPAVDAEPESVATGVPTGLEHHDGDFEPSADDSIAQAEFEPTAEPVGWWPQSAGAAAAGPSDEGDARRPTSSIRPSPHGGRPSRRTSTMRTTSSPTGGSPRRQS